MGGDEIKMSIDVTHQNYPEMQFSELRVTKSMTLSQLKQFLSTKTGTTPDSMELYNKSNGESMVISEVDDQISIETLGITSGAQLHIIDTSECNLIAEDVPHFTISDEKYEQLKGNLKSLIPQLKKQTNYIKNSMPRKCTIFGVQAEIVDGLVVGGESVVAIRPSEPLPERDANTFQKNASGLVCVPFREAIGTLKFADASVSSKMTKLVDATSFS